VAVSSSSSNRAEEFDPYAFAERWYEENPWAWERYSQALARQIERWSKMNLEQAIAKSAEFGSEVRKCEDAGDAAGAFELKSDWSILRDNFAEDEKDKIVEAFVSAHSPLSELAQALLEDLKKEEL
jgi:hypothetical protein